MVKKLVKKQEVVTAPDNTIVNIDPTPARAERGVDFHCHKALVQTTIPTRPEQTQSRIKAPGAEGPH